MPVIISLNGVRIVIRFRDHAPPHVHVLGPDYEVLVYLETLATGSQEAERLRKLAADFVRENLAICWRKWNEIHGEKKR